ncbi:uncharacterized protein MELLADRAFT_118032 [Melampsora larici-populina 98AG31]|uniref:Secreted protein n=1 Tax=Melampsora larici-populina (strain 98AG31 / pathotype 3-4-7) TaxID=747676 RepID=F4S4I2_MELLP|nr:uncharacterized protein MELLADRAFT_118032 [Melampsora larici-populina 98AG31]EGG00416.1 hypothetical protein MELLADRAFT_118032 [Melampsora larici-populina 98AG31]
MTRVSTYISLIALLLGLSSSTSAISLRNDQNIPPDKINRKWSADTSLSSGLEVWKVLGSSSLSSEVSNSETRISFSQSGAPMPFSYSGERHLHEAKSNAHIFHESLQEVLHHPKRLTKQRVKRALEGMFTGGRNIEEAAQAAKAAKAAETISNLNKAREVSGSTKALSSADASKLGKADSFFRGAPSRLDPVPALTRSKSLPSSWPETPVIDQKAALKAINTHFDKSMYQLTDSVLTRERPPRTPLIAAVLDHVDPAYYVPRRQRLTLEASFALYAERNLYWAVIDGKTDMKTIDRLANLVDTYRAEYVDTLERAIKVGYNEKTFLNTNSVQDANAEVTSLRKMTSGNEINPSLIKDAKKPPKGSLVAFPENMAADAARDKNPEKFFEDPLLEITYNEVSRYLYSPESSIKVFPAGDASVETVRGWANEAVARDHLYEIRHTKANYDAARTARTQYQWYFQSYLKKYGPNWTLFTDLSEIFNRNGIPLTLKTPPKSKVLVWYDQFKSRYQMSMYKLKSVFKTALDKKIRPVSSSPVRSP